MLRPDRHAPPTRHACPQSHKGDRVDAVFKIDEAAEVSGNIADDGSARSDHEDWNNKSGVAIGKSCKTRGVH